APGPKPGPALTGHLRVTGLRYGPLQSPADVVASIEPAGGGSHRVAIHVGSYLELGGELRVPERRLALQGRINGLPVSAVAADLAGAEPTQVSANVALEGTGEGPAGVLTLQRVRVHLPDRLFSSPQLTVRVRPEAVVLEPFRVASESLVVRARGQ